MIRLMMESFEYASSQDMLTAINTINSINVFCTQCVNLSICAGSHITNLSWLYLIHHKVLRAIKIIHSKVFTKHRNLVTISIWPRQVYYIVFLFLSCNLRLSTLYCTHIARPAWTSWHFAWTSNPLDQYNSRPRKT